MIRLVTFYFLTITISAVYAGSFSEEEQIKANLDIYLDQVFNEENPTIEQYFSFQGIHDEREYVEERLYCKKHFPLSTDYSGSQENNYSQECLSWIKDRSISTKSSKSLFYERIRKQYDSLPFYYEILEISKIRREIGDAYMITIKPSNGPILTLVVRQAIDDPGKTRTVILETKN